MEQAEHNHEHSENENDLRYDNQDHEEQEEQENYQCEEDPNQEGQHYRYQQDEEYGQQENGEEEYQQQEGEEEEQREEGEEGEEREEGQDGEEGEDEQVQYQQVQYQQEPEQEHEVQQHSHQHEIHEVRTVEEHHVERLVDKEIPSQYVTSQEEHIHYQQIRLEDKQYQFPPSVEIPQENDRSLQQDSHQGPTNPFIQSLPPNPLVTPVCNKTSSQQQTTSAVRMGQSQLVFASVPAGQLQQGYQHFEQNGIEYEPVEQTIIEYQPVEKKITVMVPVQKNVSSAQDLQKATSTQLIQSQIRTFVPPPTATTTYLQNSAMNLNPLNQIRTTNQNVLYSSQVIRSAPQPQQIVRQNIVSQPINLAQASSSIAGSRIITSPLAPQSFVRPNIGTQIISQPQRTTQVINFPQTTQHQGIRTQSFISSPQVIQPYRVSQPALPLAPQFSKFPQFVSTGQVLQNGPVLSQSRIIKSPLQTGLPITQVQNFQQAHTQAVTFGLPTSQVQNLRQAQTTIKTLAPAGTQQVVQKSNSNKPQWGFLNKKPLNDSQKN